MSTSDQISSHSALLVFLNFLQVLKWTYVRDRESVFDVKMGHTLLCTLGLFCEYFSSFNYHWYNLLNALGYDIFVSLIMSDVISNVFQCSIYFTVDKLEVIMQLSFFLYTYSLQIYLCNPPNNMGLVNV